MATLILYKSKPGIAQLDKDFFENAKYEVTKDKILNFTGDQYWVDSRSWNAITDLDLIAKIEDRFVLTGKRKRLFRKPIEFKYVPCWYPFIYKKRKHVNISVSDWVIIEKE